YKKIPNSIKLQLFELHNRIFKIIIQGDYKLDKKQIINGFKIWIMVNKIVLAKLNRGGNQTTKIMLNKINNINQGKLLNEWKQLLLRCELNKNNDEYNRNVAIDETIVEKQNIKKMIKLVQQGNVYKEYNQLKSKGIAPLNNQSINILQSKLINGQEHILKQEIQHSNLVCNE